MTAFQVSFGSQSISDTALPTINIDFNSPTTGGGGNGGGGNTTSSLIVHEFSYGDATPFQITTIPAGKFLISISLSISLAFNDPSSYITVQDATEEFFNANNCLTSEVGIYQVNPGKKFLTGSPLSFTIFPFTSSTGAGAIFLELA